MDEAQAAATDLNQALLDQFVISPLIHQLSGKWCNGPRGPPLDARGGQGEGGMDCC